MTVDSSTITVFFCLLVLEGPAGEGSGRSARSVAGLACNSTSSGGIESVWEDPAFFLFFFFLFVVGRVDWVGSAIAAVSATSPAVCPETMPCSVLAAAGGDGKGESS